MFECCTLPGSNEVASQVSVSINRSVERCPSCGAKGKRVERLTGKAGNVRAVMDGMDRRLPAG